MIYLRKMKIGVISKERKSLKAEDWAERLVKFEMLNFFFCPKEIYTNIHKKKKSLQMILYLSFEYL